MPNDAPQADEWYKDRNIYIHIDVVDAGGRWATIHCYVMRPGNHYFDRTYMQSWTKSEQSVAGMSSWELLPEPPDNVLEALNWPCDYRGYYAGPMRGADG